jgi:outer membrane protein OmpA-like peptidoglycan-associated protein
MMKAAHSLLLAGTILALPVHWVYSSAVASQAIFAQAAPANEQDQGEHNRQKQKKAPKHETQPSPGAVKPHEKQSPAAQRHAPAAQNPKSAQTPTGQEKLGQSQQPKRVEKPRGQQPQEREAQPVGRNRAPKSAEQPKKPASAAQQSAPSGHENRQSAKPFGPYGTAPKSAGEPKKPASAAQQPAPSGHEKRQTAQPSGPPEPSSHAAVIKPSHPAVVSQPIQRAAAPASSPTAVPPPTQSISKQQFIAPKGQAPSANIAQLKQERHEVREGNRRIIREPDRMIVSEGPRIFVRHNEVDRFAVDARTIHVDRRGNNTVTIVERPDGVRIINISDDQGHLIRRVRRDPDGREIVIIDNSFAGPRLDQMFVDLPPPVIRIPRDRYIVDANRAREADIYDVFIAPPVDHIEHRYTLDEVRYSEPLRARMPRVDLDMTFDTGSWQLTPDQVDRLSIIARALNRAIARNPREVFLIEGHTDAVGSDIDNLSLSDRRAESVAVAFTEEFHVPAENLVTQGYGKQDLKIPINGPERANRRVAIRRITPLIDRLAQN